MRNNFEAAVSILASAAEHDRRHDKVLRDQALNEVATPAQQAEFWRRLDRGDSAEKAARGALGTPAFPDA